MTFGRLKYMRTETVTSNKIELPHTDPAFGTVEFYDNATVVRYRSLASGIEAHAAAALKRGELAEHDLLQIALTQLDEVRKTVERARQARSVK